MERKLERVRLSEVDLTDVTFCARVEFTDEEIWDILEKLCGEAYL